MNEWLSFSTSEVFQYLKGSPDYVEFLLDDYGEFLLFDVSGVRDHMVGKSQGICRNSLGPSIVLKHSDKKGFGEKHVPSSLWVSGTQELCLSQSFPWGLAILISHGKGRVEKKVSGNARGGCEMGLDGRRVWIQLPHSGLGDISLARSTSFLGNMRAFVGPVTLPYSTWEERGYGSQDLITFDPVLADQSTSYSWQQTWGSGAKAETQVCQSLSQEMTYGDIPGDKWTPCSQCRVPGLDPWLGN